LGGIIFLALGLVLPQGAPANGVWGRTGDLNVARYDHVAT
jgi:hypothetical protein